MPYKDTERKRQYDRQRHAARAGLPSMPEQPLQVIALGAGVQSSTMALMASHGEIKPMPECAVFADTGWESPRIYEWLDWLREQLRFPVHVVQKSDIKRDQLRDAALNRTFIPFFTRTEGRSRGMLGRKCSGQYKLVPIEQFIRHDLLGLPDKGWAPKRVVVEQWLGISKDELYRIKRSMKPWLSLRYPLAEELGMTREDCVAWMLAHGYPKPMRSVCVGCPYQSDAEWREKKRHHPNEWQDAVAFDDAIRSAAGSKGAAYLHRQCVPLADADLNEDQGDLFADECDGICGT